MSELKVGFFLGGKKVFEKEKLEKITEGNPGMGGTYFMYLIVVYMLAQRLGRDNVCLILEEGSVCDCDNFCVVKVRDAREAVAYCGNNGIGKLVINGNDVYRFEESGLFDSEISFYIWGHNYAEPKCARFVGKYASVKKYICVSKAQCENMLCYPCRDKVTYVNNLITDSFYERTGRACSDHSRKEAVYVGSIFPQKGLHNLLEAWKTVVKQNPDAVLYVIGSSAVWGQAAGKNGIGIADRMYESIIRRKMRGIPPETVVFKGAMGWNEISPVIAHARVGVVNPSTFKRDETFCISAIEISAHGIPVISRNNGNGLNSTVKDGKTGFLCGSRRELTDKISVLLNDEKLSRRMGEEARNYAGEFLTDAAIDKWIRILEDNDTERDTAVCTSTRVRELYCHLNDRLKLDYYRVLRFVINRLGKC